MQVGAAAATTHVAVIAYDVTARRGAALTRGAPHIDLRSAMMRHTHTHLQNASARGRNLLTADGETAFIARRYT